MTTKLKAALAALCALFLVACDFESELLSTHTGGSTESITIAAATELKDMEPLIQRASKELGFGITMQYPDGTIANSLALKDGKFDGTFDATWFATNKYVDLYGAGEKLEASTSIATSPIAFGVRKEKADELGWTNKQPSWKDITQAVKDKKFHYGMTDPSRSNSGFSALVSVATAHADTGAALQPADMSKVQGPLRDFFAGQNLTSGSSGWLEDSFVADPTRTDAILNYESVLLQLKREGKANIEVVVPSDGVVTADYPLAALKNPKTGKAREQVEKLTQWLKDHNGDIVADTMRRAVDPNVAALPEHQKNTLIELPFPARLDVADELTAAFANDLRLPAKTVFVLDKSGSMRGKRIESLHNILLDLVGGTARTSTGPVGLRNREEVSIIGFNGEVDRPITGKYSTSNRAQNQVLVDAIDGLQAGGNTAVYSALRAAYDQFPDNAGDNATIPSIVLMSDGMSNSGMTYADFEKFYRSLSDDKQQIPVFAILYGESNIKEMQALANLTGGKTFDATRGELADAFKEIRGYQ